METLNLSPDELLTTTRAVRKRLNFDAPVDDALVRECVEIALQAPTGWNEQGWHFVVVSCVNGRVEKVPAEFAVVTQASTYGSIVPAVWSFMLAARARGLGTAWTTLHLFRERVLHVNGW